MNGCLLPTPLDNLPILVCIYHHHHHLLVFAAIKPLFLSLVGNGATPSSPLEAPSLICEAATESNFIPKLFASANKQARRLKSNYFFQSHSNCYQSKSKTQTLLRLVWLGSSINGIWSARSNAYSMSQICKWTMNKKRKEITSAVKLYIHGLFSD